MTPSPTNYPLLKSVDDLEQKNHHSILLYDNPQYGQSVKNHFIENGLKKGEHVICLTHDDVKSLEKEIGSTGIDVEYYKQKNQLHLYRIENILEKNCTLERGFNDLVKKLTSDAKPPYRFVGTVIPDVSNDEGIQAELILEQLVHSNFDNYQCSFLCTYQLQGIEKTHRSLWLQELLANHHNVFYATDPEKAVSFEPELLK